MENQKYAGPERRKSERFEFRTIVDCAWGEEYYFNSSLNMSMNGMYFETDKPLKCGSEVTLRFPLPNLDWIFQAKGKVVWTNVEKGHKSFPVEEVYPGMGIHCFDMNEEDIQAMKVWFDSIEENLREDDE